MDITPYHAKYFAYEPTKRCPSDTFAVSWASHQTEERTGQERGPAPTLFPLLAEDCNQRKAPGGRPYAPKQTEKPERGFKVYLAWPRIRMERQFV
jgi:hypothetical protein